MTPISVGRNLLVMAGLGAFLAGPASAAIIETWGYNASTIFIEPVTFNDSNPLQQGFTTSKLSWGNTDEAERSSLTIRTSPSVGMVDTLIGGGLPVPPFIGIGNSVTHDNVRIPPPNPDLNIATLRGTLLLTPGAPAPGAQFALPPLDFGIRFRETPNAGPCAAGTPTPCRDIFVLIAGLLNQPFMYDSDGVGGDDPVTYFANVFPLTGGMLGTLSTLEDEECAAAGAGNGCIGFTTPEDDDTTIQFGFTISTERLGVPEPGSLALLGAALLAVGFLRVRRKS